jgi:uncharacterized protein (TIGR00255 family)
MNANEKRPKKEAQSSDNFCGLPTILEKKASINNKSSTDGQFYRKNYLQIPRKLRCLWKLTKFFAIFFYKLFNINGLYYFCALMLRSMTGFGRANGNYQDKTIMVELRSLNSKVTDLKLRYPSDYRDKELEIRRLVNDHATRGKIDFVLEVQNADGAATVSLNEPLFRGYFLALSKLADDLDMSKADLLPTIMRIPNVVATQSSESNEEEWEYIQTIILQALKALEAFRKQEGKTIATDLRQRVETIKLLLQQVTPYEQERFARMRERLRTNMEEIFGKENIDTNRFEQELIYYLEKMDMSEEKQRLAQHCHYFIEQMAAENSSNGRTLTFITQEMGREINTLGAKAYDAEIQRMVVQMKDELEKIKEQLANVL